MIKGTSITSVGKRVLLAYLVGGPLFLTGCGGTSQDDMRRHAIRRTPDEQAPDAPSPENGEDRSSDARPHATASVEPDASSQPAGDAVTGPTAARQLASAGAAKDDEEAFAVRGDAIPAVQAPAEPLSEAERRKRTAENLTRIGQAWNAYFQSKGYFPGPIVSDTKMTVLSWRVELLPYLGLQTLYDAFHRNEPWDSPHNIALLDRIPGVFQSPERFDTTTNYLALSLNGSTVYQERRKRVASDIEDGIENTLAFVETGDEHAVPWTQPAEYALTLGTPLESMGNLRGNGLFVVWSNGKASWIDAATSPQLLAQACTIDAGDGFAASQIARDLSAGVAIFSESSSEAAVNDEVVNDKVPPVSEHSAAGPDAPSTAPKRPTLKDAQANVKPQSGDQPARPLFKKERVPTASELKISRELLRELYQADYAAAKTTTEQLQLARKMLDRLPDLGGDVPGQYALLEIVMQISIQAGGVGIALDSVDELLARFELPGDLSFETFEKLARAASDRREVDRFLEEAELAFDDFVRAEQYEAAQRLSQLARSVAKRIDDTYSVEQFAVRHQWASEAKDLHQAAEEGLASLEHHPEDPRANCVVGKFLCLIQDDWENGLVLLAHGNDRSLQRLAVMEIGDLSEPMRKLALADLWWREAESASSAFKSTMQSRAKYWYEQSLPGLPAGLVRIRVERRIEDIAMRRVNSS